MHGEVDQVPVVGLLGILQVHLYYLVALGNGIGVVLHALGGLLLKLRNQDEEAAEAHLVPAVC